MPESIQRNAALTPDPLACRAMVLLVCYWGPDASVGLDQEWPAGKETSGTAIGQTAAWHPEVARTAAWKFPGPAQRMQNQENTSLGRASRRLLSGSTRASCATLRRCPQVSARFPALVRIQPATRQATGAVSLRETRGPSKDRAYFTKLDCQDARIITRHYTPGGSRSSPGPADVGTRRGRTRLCPRRDTHPGWSVSLGDFPASHPSKGTLPKAREQPGISLLVAAAATSPVALPSVPLRSAAEGPPSVRQLPVGSHGNGGDGKDA